MNLVLNACILILLLVLSGIFAATETALFSLTRIERRRIAERHPKLNVWVKKLLDNPRHTLTAILAGNLLVNVLATAMVTLVSLKLWGAQWVGVSLFVFTLILIFFGEVLAKMAAVKYNQRIAMTLAFPLFIFSTLIFPLRFVLRAISDRILSLLVKEKKEQRDVISEEELRALVKIGEEEGVFDRQERYMLQKVFELGERPVRDIMVPRTAVIGLDIEDRVADHTEEMRAYHFSHFPVYRDSIDNVLGIVSAQEYILGDQKNLEKILIQPLIVPETKLIDDLLAEFQRKKKNFAVCVDEFGGTAGIVTQEDILEEIFGEFYDEYAKVDHPIRSYGHREFLVEAKISLTDFNEFFSSEIESEESTTLGGFILEELGEVPKKGQMLNIPGFEIKVHDVIRHRYIRLVVVKRVES